MNSHHRVKRTIKHIGRAIFRATDDAFAKQSTVEDTAILNNADFPWTDALSRSSESIRRESEALFARLSLLPPFQEISPDQGRISPDDTWRVVMLRAFGVETEFARSLCPSTFEALDRIPDGQTAFFSILEPGKHIPRHQGVTRAVVRAHLGLRVPRDAERCRMDVDGERIVWREDEVVIFDDSRPHEVWNDTGEARVVLIVDVIRPMRRPGRALYTALSALLRRSHYIQDGLTRQRAWEAKNGAKLLASVLSERYPVARSAEAR